MIAMIKEIELFGEKVPVKNYLCTNDPDHLIKGEYRFNLYIKITDYCNAKCQFCSNQDSIPHQEKIDLHQLELVLQELKRKQLLGRVSITGGEPFLHVKRLNLILNKVFEVLPDACVTINTNGIHFGRIHELDTLSLLEGIHISRHHYDDVINDHIFGVKTATLNEIKTLYDCVDHPKLIRLNCLLINGYIDRLKEVKKYLEEASKVGVFRVGFVSLMPTNSYCRENYINFNTIFQNLPFDFFSTNHFYDSSICECCNGIYLGENGNLVEYYARMTKQLHCDYMRQLVYTPQNELQLGFQKRKVAIPKK